MNFVINCYNDDREGLSLETALIVKSQNLIKAESSFLLSLKSNKEELICSITEEVG